MAHVSSSYALRQYRSCVDPDCKYPTLHEERERDCWVAQRAHDLYCDDDYLLDLLLNATEQRGFTKILSDLRDGPIHTACKAQAQFNAALMTEARKVAESEARVRFGF